MKCLYNLGVCCYVSIIHLIAPFNQKAKLWVKGRKNIFKQIAEQVDATKNTAWFHVSSLGEFEQGRPVIEAFRIKYPDFQIVLTFFSPSGYEVRKNYAGADAIFYLPSDSARNARRFIRFVNPKFAFFVKYEFWFHYLNELNKQNIQTYIFSAIFRPQQHFFKWYGGWYRKMLGFFNYIWVQNSESENLLKKIGLTNISIGGDTRFDRVYQISCESKSVPLVELFCKDKQVIIAGSTWEKDESALEYMLKTLDFDVQLVLAPHEIHESNLVRIEALFGKSCIRMSQASPQNVENYKVLLVDSIGLLSSLYKYGQVAYIGGGFGHGIHNTLEAATFGIPVIFGPNFHRFQEANDLISEKAAFSITTFEKLVNIVFDLFKHAEKQILAGKIARKYVDKMRGGTDLVMAKIDA